MTCSTANYPKKRRYLIFIIFFLFLVIALPNLLIFIIENILYSATFAYKSQPKNIYSRYQTSTYDVGSGKIDVVYRDQGDRDVFVYFHGNIGRLNYILDYLNENTSFIAAAYPGYHRSRGKPNVNDTLVSVKAIIPHIFKIFGRDMRIHVIGHSLGSQTSSYFTSQILETSEKDRLKTLSIVAGFPSIRNQCNSTLGFFSFLCFPANKSFNANKYLQVFQNPSVMNEPPDTKVILYHLPSDNVIAYDDGKILYQGIPLPESHSDYLGANKRFIDLNSGTHGNFDIADVVANALLFQSF